MYSIKTFNNISDVIFSTLKDSKYSVSSDISSYDAALVRSYNMQDTNFDEKVVAVARAGAGTNNIPVDRCSEQGIVVFNTPGANANAVKELVLCGMLLSGRKIIEGIEWTSALKDIKAEDFEKQVEGAKKQFTGPELAGKRLGVIGLGAIGVMVANAAHHGLGMEVVGYDPYMSVDAAWNLSRSIIHATTLEEIYSTCDYITLHLPLLEKTKGTIGETALSSMKKDAVILNFARGPLVDSSALINALDNGVIRGYITDFPELQICGHKNVIAIPHLGASTPESEENCAHMAAKQLKDYLELGTIKNSINLPDCELPSSPSYRLAIINRNVTNMVGQVTAQLADDSMNIDHMINKSKGSWAYTLIDLDKKPSSECINRLKSIEGIVRVRIIEP